MIPYDTHDTLQRVKATSGKSYVVHMNVFFERFDEWPIICWFGHAAVSGREKSDR